MIDIYSLKKIKLENFSISGTPSSVLIPFFKNNDDWLIYFIKRIDDNSIHSAQVAFPGGKKDLADNTLLDTALRETFEEIGIEGQNVEIISALEPTMTLSSHFSVYPFVGVIRETTFNINKSEVAYIFDVPLSFLISQFPFKLEKFYYKGRIFDTFLIKYEDEIIWGATARILNNLLGKIIDLRSEYE